MLSRLFEENEINENPKDDYLDVLIAAIKHEPSQEEEDASIDQSSHQVRKKTAQDQDQDEEIKWVKYLILQHDQESQKPPSSEISSKEYFTRNTQTCKSSMTYFTDKPRTRLV